MEKYDNEEYVKREIMGQDRHLFLYGYQNDYRSRFLRGLEKEYPLVLDSNKPCALFFDNLGIARKDGEDLKGKDLIALAAASREYAYFMIAERMIERAMEHDWEMMNSRLSGLVNAINSVNEPSHANVKNISDLLIELKKSRRFYYNLYNGYVNGTIKSASFNKLHIPFMEIDMFVRLFQEGANLDSYFGVIYDKIGTLSVPSVQAINNLIGSRINDEISMKVAIEPDNWESYRSQNGGFVQGIHDYGTVELDDSYDQYMRKLTHRDEE